MITASDRHSENDLIYGNPLCGAGGAGRPALNNEGIFGACKQRVFVCVGPKTYVKRSQPLAATVSNVLVISYHVVPASNQGISWAT